MSKRKAADFSAMCDECAAKAGAPRFTQSTRCKHNAPTPSVQPFSELLDALIGVVERDVLSDREFVNEATAARNAVEQAYREVERKSPTDFQAARQGGWCRECGRAAAPPHQTEEKP